MSEATVVFFPSKSHSLRTRSFPRCPAVYSLPMEASSCARWSPAHPPCALNTNHLPPGLLPSTPSPSARPHNPPPPTSSACPAKALGGASPGWRPRGSSLPPYSDHTDGGAPLRTGFLNGTVHTRKQASRNYSLDVHSKKNANPLSTERPAHSAVPPFRD